MASHASSETIIEAIDHPSRNEISQGDLQVECRTRPTKEEYVSVCSFGDVFKLQELLDSDDRRDKDPLKSSDDLDIQYYMINAAVRHKRATIVKYILQRYPNVDVCYAEVIQQASQNPHLETFKLLHAHSPRITNHVWFMDGHSTLLESLILGGGNPVIPNFLLDHGVDPNSAQENRQSSHLNPLFYSIRNGLSFEIVEKFLNHGADISAAVLPAAIERGNIPIIELVLQRTTYIDAMENRRTAKKTGNQEITALVKRRAKTLTPVEKQARKRWWLLCS